MDEVNPRGKRLLENYINKYIKKYGFDDTKEMIKVILNEIYEKIRDITPSDQETVVTYTLEDKSDMTTLNFEEHREFLGKLREDVFEECGFDFSQTESWSCWYDPTNDRYYEVTFIEDDAKIEMIRKYYEGK